MPYQCRPTKMTTNKKATNIMFGKYVKKLEISYIDGRSINWHNSILLFREDLKRKIYIKFLEDNMGECLQPSDEEDIVTG